jgi:hypothetical protein
MLGAMLLVLLVAAISQYLALASAGRIDLAQTTRRGAADVVRSA